MNNNFKELYQKDVELITPSDELLARISEKAKKPPQNTVRFSQGLSHISMIAAGIAVVIVSALVLPVLMQDNLVTTDDIPEIQQDKETTTKAAVADNNDEKVDETKDAANYVTTIAGDEPQTERETTISKSEYYSYTEWAQGSVWDSLITDLTALPSADDNNTAVDNAAPETAGSMRTIQSNLKIFGDFAKQYLSSVHITEYSFLRTGNTEYRFSQTDFTPFYSLLNKYLDADMTFYPNRTNETNGAIQIFIKAIPELIQVCITNNDRVILQIEGAEGRYEFGIENGAHQKLWSYLNRR